MSVSAQFDPHSQTYRAEVEQSIDFIGRNLDFFTAPKAEYLLTAARDQLGDPSSLEILDIGCGTGETDRFLVGAFDTIHGVDVSDQMIEQAAAANPSCLYQAYDGDALPYVDASVDVSFASCVLHHVPPSDQQALVDEMCRVTRTPGLVVIIEHNPLNPLTRLAVSRCAFDENATLLRPSRVKRLLGTAGLLVADARYIIFFPWRGPVFRAAERALRWLPLGAQYAAAGRR